jgi:hypothetical protein
MRRRAFLAAGWAASLSALLSSQPGFADPSAAAPSRLEAALANIAALERPGQIGLATFWDGNKYVQCRRLTDRTLKCKSAGALMQPSLSHVLTAERVAQLAALGWSLDPSFGNYSQTFPADAPASAVADKVSQALTEGYDADLSSLQVRTDWIANAPCPPRNGPTQNLAGMIDDPPPLPKGAIYACSYTPAPAAATGSAADLINVYGARATGEIQRLRVNLDREIFVVLETDIGFVQCAPENSPPSIYCEAQSADSWPALSSVLTPERVVRLHMAGYADPGRAPNYWKNYPLDIFNDAMIARELLTILYEVYGYAGSPKLKIATEKGG